MLAPATEYPSSWITVGDRRETEAAVGDKVDRHRWWLLGGVCALGLVMTTGASGATAALAQAATPAPEDVAAGMRIYRQKADCQACHGWAADGHKMESQMPDGANLRATKLDREKVVTVIKCGIPGKSMPAFDRLAYSDGRCYGMTLEALKKLGGLPDAAATLQPREVEQVADFLFSKVVGKGPMDRAACIEYFGSVVEVCNDLK
jgi:mono/diheme cytochrome c family protein